MAISHENADTISINTLAFEEILKEEREKEIEELNNLPKSFRHLHTKLLYYRNVNSRKGSVCYDAWRTLVKNIGCSPDTWKDLGYLLGASNEDLEYITYSIKDDPVDTVLKLFIQNEENATMDKVMGALLKLKRYDILKKLETPLFNLSKCFEKEDSGYHSLENPKKEIVSYAKYVNDLPAALNKNIVLKSKEPNRPKHTILRTLMEKENNSNENPILFLTFVHDGFETALNIQRMVEEWDDITDVTVIILNEKKSEIYENPEKCIRECFEKADFIVPILTVGYFDSIKSNHSSAPSTTENIDFKYAPFIYNMIANYYIHRTGCLNKKVRSVLPMNSDLNVLIYVSMYPELVPWTNECKFDEQFKVFLRTLK